MSYKIVQMKISHHENPKNNWWKRSVISKYLVITGDIDIEVVMVHL